MHAVELLAPWAASDARYLHPAPSVRTERGAGKRYFAFTLRLADEPGSGGVASSIDGATLGCGRVAGAVGRQRRTPLASRAMCGY